MSLQFGEFLVLKLRNKTCANSVYNQLLVEAMRTFKLLVALCYLDHRAHQQRNWSYTRTLGIMLEKIPLHCNEISIFAL